MGDRFKIRSDIVRVAENDIEAMKLAVAKPQFVTPRTILLGLSIVSLAICAWAGAAHYRNASWGDLWQPVGWLFSMIFLLAAFFPGRERVGRRFKC